MIALERVSPALVSELLTKADLRAHGQATHIRGQSRRGPYHIGANCPFTLPGFRARVFWWTLIDGETAPHNHKHSDLVSVHCLSGLFSLEADGQSAKMNPGSSVVFQGSSVHVARGAGIALVANWERL